MKPIDFKTFVNVFWPLVTSDARIGERVRALLSSIVFFTNEEDDFLSGMNDDTLRRYHLRNAISRSTAEQMLPFLDNDSFIRVADDAAPDAKRHAADQLGEMSISASPGDVAEKGAEILANLMVEEIHRLRLWCDIWFTRP